MIFIFKQINQFKFEKPTEKKIAIKCNGFRHL